jgi:hypothetical protein
LQEPAPSDPPLEKRMVVRCCLLLHRSGGPLVVGFETGLLFVCFVDCWKFVCWLHVADSKLRGWWFLVLIMIAMVMMIVVLMYQQECHMDWISDGVYDNRAGVMVHHN